MKLNQTFKIAFKAIMSSKMRSFLTMLGIIIGVASVTLLVAIAQGTTRAVTDSISGMGSTRLTCRISTDNADLTLENLAALEGSGSVSLVAPMLSSNVTTEAGGNTYNASIEATTPNYRDIQALRIADGRFFNEVDLEYLNYVAVIGTTVSENLYATRNAIGNEIEINGKKFLVIGVLEESGSDTTGSYDERVLIPFTTGQRLFGSNTISNFYATADSAETVNAAKTTLESYLYSLTADENAYSVYSQTQILETMSSVTDTLTLMLGGIAGISLIVGGIGIMNIMLVSVSERTREIGIRKSIGARRKDILIQFLIEAITLSLMGGLLGIGIGFGGTELANLLMGTNGRMELWISVIALSFSVVIGIGFGIYPAMKASKLRPIDALRYE